MPQLLLALATVIGVFGVVKLTTVKKGTPWGLFRWGLLLLWFALFSASLWMWLMA